MIFYWRLGRIGLHLISGILQLALIFPFFDKTQKQQRIQHWSQQLLHICGVQLTVYGAIPSSAGKLLVANHISWLDIFIINAVSPQRFIAKEDIRHWWFIGYLVAQADTIFIRRSRHAVNTQTLHNIALALREGEAIALFPEGTTSNGAEILPFKSSFLQAAIDAKAMITPLCCYYPDEAGRADTAMAYYGEISLWQSLSVLLKRKKSRAVVHFLQAETAEMDRHQLAQHLRQQLLHVLYQPHGLATELNQVENNGYALDSPLKI